MHVYVMYNSSLVYIHVWYVHMYTVLMCSHHIQGGGAKSREGGGGGGQMPSPVPSERNPVLVPLID